MSSLLIRNASIVNEGRIFTGDVAVNDDVIAYIGPDGASSSGRNPLIIEANGLFLIPGVIDDHVHFREPGPVHKAEIFTESAAAAAGGVTSFMDMPNTVPQTVTLEALKEKNRMAEERSLINYSFYIGATNTNLGEILNADPDEVCGIKLFMGSSTGNMLVDNDKALRELFSRTSLPVTAHCEDESTIRRNIEIYRNKYGEEIPPEMHPLIRSREACFISSAHAVKLAKEYNTRLHILHLSTADELGLFSGELPLEMKRITAEACVHHLWFDDSYYLTMGNMVKWNPAVKTKFDRDALIAGINNKLVDVVATDHAPHTLQEKQNSYFRSPSGGPLVQHSLIVMMELYHRNLVSLEKIVTVMCHNPAILFNIRKRGFIREGYKADLCLIDPHNSYKVTRENILYKCGWSPFEGTTFSSRVIKTIVNGNVVYDNGIVNKDHRGEKLLFDRPAGH